MTTSKQGGALEPLTTEELLAVRGALKSPRGAALDCNAARRLLAERDRAVAESAALREVVDRCKCRDHEKANHELRRQIERLERHVGALTNAKEIWVVKEPIDVTGRPTEPPAPLLPEGE